MRYRLLDLFCGAGGAAMGYHRAGFEVVGVDINPQPNYPFEFHRADALIYPLDGFDAIHASPTCQHHSKTKKILEGKGLKSRGCADHIGLIRTRIKGHLYVIENVPGSPLVNPIRLCGLMFGLRVLRHRLFESSIVLVQPPHPKHNGTTNSHRGYSRGGEYVTVGGHNYNRVEGAKAMDIDWMQKRDGELNEAIPPAYTEFIGKQLISHLEGKR
jgi:DNA (cytosine-5)-methyltransferase 1